MWFIIICPDGLKDSYYINSPKDDSQQYLDFFIYDLIPQIQKKYQIDNNAKLITGNSMGGYGALYIFLNNHFYKIVNLPLSNDIFSW